MQIERLDNGMELLLDTSGEADVAAIYAWVRAGSTAEPPGLEGAAHMLEHMVFKGTRSFGVGEVAAAIEGMGGDLNAFTSFDDTAFHCTVPAARAPEAIAVLGEMLREARIDAEELERERQVILEEIRGGEDDPDLVLGEAS
jgi:zinc protease